MDEKINAFSDDYAIESSTDAPSEPTEEEKKNQTVSGQIEYYDRAKPYRDFIRAKVIK